MMRRQFAQRLTRLALQSKASKSTAVSAGSASEMVRNDKLQFSKAILTDSNDLAQGEIPESLRFEREA